MFYLFLTGWFVYLYIFISPWRLVPNLAETPWLQSVRPDAIPEESSFLIYSSIRAFAHIDHAGRSQQNLVHKKLPAL